MAYRPPQPLVPALTGSLDQRVAQLAQAISKKADVTAEPVYSAVHLIAPGGAVWRVMISDAGALQISVVPR
jgi:hypothetical protein